MPISNKRKRTIYLILVLGILIGSVYFFTYKEVIHYLYFPLSDQEIQQYADKNGGVVVYPILTELAYSHNGFYSFFKKQCGVECLTVRMNNTNGSEHIVTDNHVIYEISPNYAVGKSSWVILKKLHYNFITDIDIDKNPKILSNYTKVILLHNEYMTANEFNAIKNHKSVIYLYPNAAYAQVSIDYQNKSISLVKGHGYPSLDYMNGFDFVTTSNHEYDIKCDNYTWEKMPNGIQLSCYPEYLILHDRELLKTLSEYSSYITKSN